MPFVAHISDLHLTPRELESESLFPEYYRSLPPEKRGHEYETERLLIEACCQAVFDELRSRSPFALLVAHGDLGGGWKQRGIAHPSVLPLVGRAMEKNRAIAQNAEACWGNHDTGYKDADGDLNPESVQGCHRISPLFWKHDVGALRYIGICTPVARSYDGDGAEIIADFRDAQAEFIADALRSLHRDQRWVLCSHDTGIGALEPQMKTYLDSLERFIFGDRHSRWSGTLESYGGYVRSGFVGACLRKSAFCPSTAPLWWRGGGYLTGVVEGSTLSLASRVARYSDRVAAGVEESPFASLRKPILFWLKMHVRKLTG